MLAIDKHLLLLVKNYLISKGILKTKRNNSIQSSELNNDKDIKSLKSTDYSEIIKALNLLMPSNRFSVLKALSQHDLIRLMFLMEKRHLLMGLKFFNRKKLLRFIYYFPKKLLLKMLLHFYSKKEVLNLFKIKELCLFLGDPRIQTSEFIKVIKTLPNEILVKILEGAKQKRIENKGKDNLLEQIQKLDRKFLVEGLRSLPHKEMVDFIHKLIHNNEKLFMFFNKITFIRPILNWSKLDMVESMKVLDPKLIIKMLSTLPVPLMAQVTTLLDPEKLAGFLQKFHLDLLDSIAA